MTAKRTRSHLVSVLMDGAAASALSLRDWEQLLGEARQHGLLARLAWRLRQAGRLEQVPTAPRHYLLSALGLLEQQRHEVLRELLAMREALQPLEGPKVLLKGAAYLLAGLPPADSRLFSDIDLMVPRPQLQAAESALMVGGWISEDHDPYNQRYYRQWMHEIPPLRHIRRGSVLDLHHGIAPLTSRFAIDASLLFEQTRPIAASGFHMLQPVDMVLHSCLHLYLEGEFDHGLRDLLDVQELLIHFGAQDGGFERCLLDRAARLGLQEPLRHVLMQLQRLLPQDEQLCRLCACLSCTGTGPWQGVISRCLSLAIVPAGPARLSHRWARQLLYIRSHGLRMPLRLLLPHLLRKAWMRHRDAAQA